jgi:cobalt/nickel transport system ATP-binding protein
VTDHKGTVVLFTPSLDVVPEIADRVIVVGPDGSIVADEPVRDVLTDSTLLRENGLRPPATVQLFEGILEVDDMPLTVSDARAHLLDQMQ